MTERPKAGLDEVLAHLAECDHDDPAPDFSGAQRVEYVVYRIRGGLADSRPVLEPTKTQANGADSLARTLKVDVDSLLGIRYSCQVVPGEYGQFQTDFQVVTSDDSATA